MKVWVRQWPKGCMIDETLKARGPAGGLGHVGLHRGLVDDEQSFQMISMKGWRLKI